MCLAEHDGTYGSGRFCCRSCANKRVLSEVTRQRIRNRLTKNRTVMISCLQCGIEHTVPWNRRNCKFCSRKCSARYRMSNLISRSNFLEQTKFSKKGRYNLNPQSIFDLSPQTRFKVISRLKLACFICGWDLARCDLHHINGKDVDDPHVHSNLTYVCPNCHRLIHRGVINVETIPTLETMLKDTWKNAYYG
jgi:hypothetical protein